jgi:general stress protein YciG
MGGAPPCSYSLRQHTFVNGGRAWRAARHVLLAGYQTGGPNMANTHTDSGSKDTNKGGNFSSDREKAAEAGKKGGQHSHEGSESKSKGGTFATDREKASEAGKNGGEHSHGGNK